jgi:DNA-binding NarL/FixJ family response regulator
MTSISLVILSEQSVTRDALRTLLQIRSDVTVVGDTGAVEDVLAWTAHSPVQLVLVDLQFPICAVHAACRIMAAAPATHVAVLSSHANDPRVAEVMAAELRRVGASALLPKTASTGELLDAIHRIVRGEAFFPAPPIADGALGPRLVAAGSEPQPSLTLRQTQVLTLVAEGFGNKEIATRLSISPKTVEKHRQSVKEKLHTNNAADLARRAIRLGLVQAV